MLMRMGAAAAAAVVLLAACGRDGGDPGQAAGQGRRTASTDEPSSPGAALYRRACVMCHGERGTGTAIGPALNGRRREADEVVRVVEAGAPADSAAFTPMPPRGDGTFTDQDVRTVAEYVRSLAR